MSSWFKRKDKGNQTPTENKKDVPKGLWYKTPSGKIVDTDELKVNYYVSPEDGYHVKIGSAEYFEILFDKNEFIELDEGMVSKDPLKFEDTKKYPDRLKAAMDKTKLKDAIRTAVGKSKGNDLVVACMDFSFIGGSLGSVMGEKISRAIDKAIELKEEDDFLKVRETLTRMGVSSRTENKLYQSCHILHKRGKYYIVHFKELFLLDGKPSNLIENDLHRRNTIATLLADWGLITVLNPEQSKDVAPLRQIKVIPYKEKVEWQLCPKYNIGNSNAKDNAK